MDSTAMNLTERMLKVACSPAVKQEANGLVNKVLDEGKSQDPEVLWQEGDDVPQEDVITGHFGTNLGKYRDYLAKEIGKSDEEISLNLADYAVKKAKNVGRALIESAMTLVYGIADIPIEDKIKAVAALGYLVFPVDVIPDLIPMLGYADDAMVVSSVVKLVSDSISEGSHAKAVEFASNIFGGPDVGEVVSEQDVEFEKNATEEVSVSPELKTFGEAQDSSEPVDGIKEDIFDAPRGEAVGVASSCSAEVIKPMDIFK